jgi:hypothetical protein
MDLAIGCTLLVDPIEAETMPGTQLLEYCGTLPPLCAGYVGGVFETLLLMGSVCTRPGVNNKQIFDVVVRYLETHPAERDKAAVTVILQATREAFPCN